MPKPRLWFERHRQRHDWALQAYDRFVHELAPEVSAQLKRSEQVTVVVYGATQVGKTTLILDLLGLASDTRQEVAQVLRGGQARGKSATVMPLRYGRSTDDHWYIGNSAALDRAQATQALADVRRGVEQGQNEGIVLTDILIPARLFPSAGDEALEVDVKLIDLPGLDARNAHERELVAALARRFVTVADLVLLVTQASSLGFLRPENLQIEELANWVHQPVRFRVVITSSYSLSSVRKRILASPLDVAAMRVAMIEEIETLDLRIPPSFSDNVYVLELGDSARDMAKGDPDYYSKVSPLVESFRRQLISDIKRSSGPFSRLFAAFQLDQVVTGQVAAFEDDYRERKAFLEAELQAFESRLRAMYSLHTKDGLWAALQEHKDTLEAQCTTIKHWAGIVEVLLETDCRVAFESLFAAPAISRGVQRVSAMQEALQSEKHALKQQSESWVDALKTLLVDRVDESVRPLLEAFFKMLRPTAFDDRSFHLLEYQLDGYSWDRYWKSSSYDGDVWRLDVAVRESRQHHIKLAHEDFVSGLRLQATSQREALSAIQVQLQQVQKAIETYEIHRGGLLALSAELDGNIARMHDSQEIARHFERRVHESFSNALQASSAEITQGRCATEKFLGLMNAHLIINEAEKFYSGKPAT